jgi:YegS/Rv2252/BmrU family lipid kinase
MSTVAVVAHAGKSMEGGLPELREALAREGVTDPLWFEVDKSRKAAKRARKAAKAGSELIFVWGGDGTVQRCIDALADTDATIAILPAGTANLLATNLGVPSTIDEAVRTGLHGERRRLDIGRLNGEHFAVMAGAGFDALMIDEADAGLKDRFGRLAYVWTGGRNVDAPLVGARIKVDGKEFYRGNVSCVLVGNVAKVFGGIEAFSGSTPHDGRLEIGVVTASGPVQWARTVTRVALGSAEKSPFVEVASGKRFRIRFDKKLPYEIDGGTRSKTRKLRVDVRPGAVEVCVPAAT